MIKKLNSRGVTLIELTISILVGSIMLTTLMSTLMMITSTNAKMQIDAKMENESFIMAETLKHTLQPQLSKTFTFFFFPEEDEYTLFIDYCVIEDGQTKSCTRDDPDDDFHPHMLTLSPNGDGTASLTFNDVSMFGDNVRILDSSSISFTSYDEDENNTAYPFGLLTMTIEMQLVLADGSILETKTYVTQIIFSRY